jgi:hypothetical protein|tara:strand:+ start:595 stop:885 length:291 start_codon:yes stop_codon:yes gene_type:complete
VLSLIIVLGDGATVTIGSGIVVIITSFATSSEPQLRRKKDNEQKRKTVGEKNLDENNSCIIIPIIDHKLTVPIYILHITLIEVKVCKKNGPELKKS